MQEKLPNDNLDTDTQKNSGKDMRLQVLTGVSFLQYSEKLHLLLPRVWQGGVEFGQGKRPWSFPRKDGIHDRRSK